MFLNLDDVRGERHHPNMAQIVEIRPALPIRTEDGHDVTHCTEIVLANGKLIMMKGAPNDIVGALHSLQAQYEGVLQQARMKATIEFQRAITAGGAPVVLGVDGMPISIGAPKRGES